MADNKDEIVFTLAGLAKVLKGYKAVQDAATATAKTTGMTGGGSGPSRPSVPRPQSQPKMARYTGGPHQRLTGYKDEYARAIKDGNVLAEKDVKIAIDRTEKQLDRLKNPAFGKKLDTFIKSSRFGVGGVQPLVGATADLLGEGAEAAGPIGVFSAAAMEATRAIKDWTDKVQGSVTAFSSLQHQTGATGAETGQIKALAGALQTDPSQLAGIAAGLGPLASGGGFGTLAAMKVGLSPYPAPYAHLDQGADLLKLIKYLKNDKSESDALMVSRQLGAESLMPVRDMLPDTYNTLMASAKQDSGVYDKKARQDAADYMASQARLTTATDRLKESIDKAVAPWLTHLQNKGADKIDAFTQDAKKNGWIDALSKVHLPAWLGGPLSKTETAGPDKHLDPNQTAANRFLYGNHYLDDSSAVTAAGMKAQEAKEAKEAENRHTSALDRHSAAMDKHGQMMMRNYGNVTRGDFLPKDFSGNKPGWGLYERLRIANKYAKPTALDPDKADYDRDVGQLGSF